MRTKKKATLLGAFILVLATLFYFYEFFLRVILGTIAAEIMVDLHIGAEQFALIGSAYYLTYSLMQPPVGILLDRYGVRFLITAACFLCNLGVLGFFIADGFTLALIARLLIGFGSSFAFVSILILALNWFPREQFGFLIGLIQLLGSLGPFLGGAPFAWVLSKAANDWRLILLGILVFGLILNFLLGIFIRTSPKGEASELIYLNKTEPLKKKLLELIKNKQVWWIISYAGAIYATLPLMGAFWGTSYLKAKGFDRQTAAFIVSMIWFGLALGCPLLGKFSDRIKRRKIPLLISPLLGVGTSLAILYLEIKSELFLCFLFFLIGLASSGQSVSFATISEHVPRKLHGAAIGLNNSAVTFSGFLIPPIVSYLIVLASPEGAKTFTVTAFNYGFTLIPVLYGLSLLIAIFGIKETFCRQGHEVFYLEK